MLSVVIPVHKDESDLLALYDRLTAALERLKRPYEVIFVDDTPGNRTFDLLANLVETDSRLKVLRLRRDAGQSPALAAGFDEAAGEVIVTLDADLRNDPEDIALLLEKIDQGYDIASGWRRNHGTSAVARVQSWVVKRATGMDLHDFGVIFRAYRAEVLKDVNLYGELHRFIPALASFYGARAIEVPLGDTRARKSERSFTIRKTVRLLFDLITVKFLLQYLTRPMHFFGKWGLVGVAIGSVALAWMAISKLLGTDIFTEHGPLLVASALIWFGGLILFCVGLIGEVLVRTYFESQGRRIYAIREIRCRRDRLADEAR